MTPLLAESLLSPKPGSVSQNWLRREAERVLFWYLGYSIRLPQISFSFIIEGSLVLYMSSLDSVSHSALLRLLFELYSLRSLCVFFFHFSHTVLSVLFSQACYF